MGARLGVALSAAAGALALLALAGTGAERAIARGGECAHANDHIDEATADQFVKSIRCLINKDRKQHNRDPLDQSGKLDRAAGKHNRTMLKKDCWSHDCPGEPRLQRRIRETGYLDGASRWRYGETFGCDVSPQAMLNTWKSNDFDRKNIRDRGFRDVGVAAARDQVGPSDCDNGNEITWTVVFGRRTG
jgi:uncharacterized protein YkwD